VVWQCPQPAYCGHLVSVAWSRDARRLALGVDSLASPTTYLGLHVVDVATGSDLHVPRVGSTAQALVAAARRALGCLAPYDLAWSTDGTHLAYVCPTGPGLSPPGRVFVIRADARDPRLLATAGADASSPTWSPDGRIAFQRRSDDAVWVVSADGTLLRRLVLHARAPAWSPDGRVIAYWSTGRCRGVRLVTPAGRDVTPAGFRCGALAGTGRPVWSPDGRQLAVGTHGGVFVMGADGTGLHRVTRQSGGGVFATGRPSWSPGPTPTPKARKEEGDVATCVGCF
jgi:dipeptidyl aminopeptidase/acylaminoacyl peptidase